MFSKLTKVLASKVVFFFNLTNFSPKNGVPTFTRKVALYNKEQIYFFFNFYAHILKRLKALTCLKSDGHVIPVGHMTS